jgi:hypothetical protein
MTNTLHRFGSAKSFSDDIIVFALPALGKSGQGETLPVLKRFMEIALEYGPVNMGDARNGGALRSTRYKNVFAHWFRRNKPDYHQVLKTMTKATTMSVVFDNLPAAQAFVKRIRDEDLGVSVNISSSMENAQACCAHAGLTRHSMNYSLGFGSIGERTHDKHAVMLSTMCGHGMIAHSLARKMIGFVKEGRRTPKDAAESLQRFCSCGIFNPTRAQRIFEDARVGVRNEFDTRTQCCGGNCPDCPFRHDHDKIDNTISV